MNSCKNCEYYLEFPHLHCDHCVNRGALVEKDKLTELEAAEKVCKSLTLHTTPGGCNILTSSSNTVELWQAWNEIKA